MRVNEHALDESIAHQVFGTGEVHMPTEKIDLLKLYKDEYVAPKKPKLVQTTPGNYLAIEGRAAPGNELFGAHMGALYTVGYTIKFTQKAAGRDFKVAMPEGIYWGFTPGQETKEMNWKLILRMPEFVTQADLEAAIEQAKKKGKPVPVEQVRLETIDEGLCVQMLHVGSYDTEPVTLAQMMELVQEENKQVSGPHHEIYLSDPMKVAPEKLRTILRMPVADKA
jgi:hypothetical protein